MSSSQSPLFPAFVALHTICFDAHDPADLGDQFPGVVLPPLLARAVRKRQAEFLAGRLCVREALRACAPEHAESVVAIGPHREPLWPPGIVGSITHADGFASAAVARTAHARSLGLDVEQIVDPSSVENLIESIAHTDELLAITRATGWATATALTAIFSAKETLFKCLYPELRRYFDFREAWLDAFAPESGTFRIRLLQALGPGLSAGRRFTGRFSIDPGVVHTAIVLLSRSINHREPRDGGGDDEDRRTTCS